ncbi:MAG: MotE family protein [Halioglobus sp.]
MLKIARVLNSPIQILVTILVVSAFIRGSTFASEAWANVDRSSLVQDSVSESDTLRADSESLQAILKNIQKRERMLSEKEEALIIREKALSLVEKKVNERIAILEQVDADLRNTLATANSAAENDLVRLTAVYENMKPADASKLFEKMTPNFAAGFLGRMRVESSAAILSRLNPDLAFAVSAILAGRNVNVPTANE